MAGGDTEKLSSGQKRLKKNNGEKNSVLSAKEVQKKKRVEGAQVLSYYPKGSGVKQ